MLLLGPLERSSAVLAFLDLHPNLFSRVCVFVGSSVTSFAECKERFASGGLADPEDEADQDAPPSNSVDNVKLYASLVGIKSVCSLNLILR